MSENNLDKETKKVLSDGEKLQNLVNGEGWGVVKAQLLAKISAVDSVSNIDLTRSADELVKDMMARAGAISIVLEWLKEIEGQAAQIQNNKQLLAKTEESFIMKVE